ncbi:MAG: serine/threonine-protein kinase [Sandaracinus sp.]
MDPGSRIGKYVIEEKLGEGGNGQVYAARDSVLGRRVALKLLHGQLIADATIAGRFRQEAQAMAQLSHPNVVIMHDFVSDGPRWAIVMELVEHGETLGSLLRREGRMAPARAVRIAMGVASALGHAHARGIVHRDVKPANVLVVRDHGREIAKLTDFGIARVMHGERRTQAQLTLGTLWYIAPEQAQSSGVDARADIYSLGATLYEALTGRVVFPYDNVARVLAAHIGEIPPSPAQLVPGIAASLDRIVMRCIAKSPDERPPNGDALRAMLEECLHELEGSSPGAYASIPGTRPMAELRGHIDAARASANGPSAIPQPSPGYASPAAAASPAYGSPTYAPSSLAPASTAALPPPPVPGTSGGMSDESGRLGLYIGLGTLAVVTGVCLLGSLLFGISVAMR